MIPLGTRRPGSTIYVEFDSYASAGGSDTISGLAVTDVEIYKNGGTTQRSSDSGITLQDTDGIDFDDVKGINGFEIDLSDDTDVGFYAAGAHYRIVVASITVDGQTVNFSYSFDIGYAPAAFLDTTIATLASQTSFTLTAGPEDDDALNSVASSHDVFALIHDKASAVQIAIGKVSDYDGGTKTVTLSADPAVFTMAAGDNISFFLGAAG